MIYIIPTVKMKTYNPEVKAITTTSADSSLFLNLLLICSSIKFFEIRLGVLHRRTGFVFHSTSEKKNCEFPRGLEGQGGQGSHFCGSWRGKGLFHFTILGYVHQ
jgi:hypothetical protein